MKTLKTKCNICNKEISYIHILKNKGNKTGYPDSEDGILFCLEDFKHYWFCNKCWSEMIKQYKKWKN